MLKKQKVSCGGCHYELVQASGRASYEAYFEGGVLKTAIVLGAGYIKKENCLACHDQAKAIKEVENKKLMHEKHVTVKTARCFDCHQPITHKKAELKQPVQAKAGKEKSVGEKIMFCRRVRSKKGSPLRPVFISLPGPTVWPATWRREPRRRARRS
jgi:hypothetical protein